jgi:pimeloyl-[acyl-carrier protein] methyl ester esterase
MRRDAPEALFLPGFDGAGSLREPFLAALREHHPVRAIDYPNRPLHTLNGYCRHALSGAPPDRPLILVAESFSGLVAARWASMDPHVVGLALCGSFARNPMAWATALGASVPGAVRFGAGFLTPPPGNRDPARLQWAKDLSRTLRELDDAVIGERLRLIANEDLRPELRSLAIPVTLLQFDDDVVIGVGARGELEEVCHNAEVVRFPGPHFAIETMPRECAEAIGPRLRSMTTTRATSGSP